MSCIKRILILSAVTLLGACSTSSSNMWLEKTTYNNIPGWEKDSASETLSALTLSCKRIEKKPPEAPFAKMAWGGKAATWQNVCSTLYSIPHATNDQARQFLENHFTPYALYGEDGRNGLFTGYYEPLLHGSTEKKPPYLTPLYSRPKNMLTAELGDFYPELKGKKITGRVEGESFIPFYKRAEIESGGLTEEIPVVWVNDPVDAFFLHIQGSGQVQMDDGSMLHIGYAAQNGHAYTAIGKNLIERGEIPREEISMQTIRAWLEANPNEAPSVMNINESYVFFRVIDGDGPLGAEGVPLTPGRSLAVDSKKIPYGTPVFINAESPESSDQRLQHLMIAQDTGGAIKGTVRGDYFWGAGEVATENAGKMKSKGEAWLLLPSTLDIPKDMEWKWWHKWLRTKSIKD